VGYAQEQEFKFPCGTLQTGRWTHIAFRRDYTADAAGDVRMTGWIDGMQYGFWQMQPFEIGMKCNTRVVVKVRTRTSGAERDNERGRDRETGKET
jgi:hypothetical protein